jgi:hypothetical protein
MARRLKYAQQYGACDCQKWGVAPPEFNETVHFMKCPCGLLMYLTMFDPRTAGYSHKNEVTPEIVNQKDTKEGRTLPPREGA